MWGQIIKFWPLVIILLVTVQAKYLFETLLCDDNTNKWVILWTFECDSFRNTKCKDEDTVSLDVAQLEKWQAELVFLILHTKSSQPLLKQYPKGMGNEWRESHVLGHQLCVQECYFHKKCSRKEHSPENSRRQFSRDHTQITTTIAAKVGHFSPSSSFPALLSLLCCTLIVLQCEPRYSPFQPKWKTGALNIF